MRYAIEWPPAEIVDDQGHPHLVEAVHLILCAVRSSITQLSVISSSRRSLASPLAASAAATVSQALVLELAARDIDRQATERQSCSHHCCAWRHAFIQYPGAQRHDQAAVLGDRYEEGWRHLFAIVILPAQQRLDPDQAAGRQVELWLITQAELVFQRPTQFAAEGKPALPRAGSSRLAEGVAVLAGFFRLGTSPHRRV